MTPKRFKKIRENLGLSQPELSSLFGFAGKSPISHIETGVRKPSALVVAFMTYLESLSERSAKVFIEEFGRHIADAVKSAERRKNE